MKCAASRKLYLDLTLKLPDGELIPVSAVAELHWQTGPRKLGTFGQQKSFRIYGGVLPGTTKEEALSALEAAAAEILPPSYSLDYAGESRQLRKEGNTLLAVLAVSLLIVYLVLAVQFNSFRDPLVVLLGCVPLALSGALLLPYLELTTINIYSQIGLITLIGLIAKNGILDRGICQSYAGAGDGQAGGGNRGGYHAFASYPDDHGGHCAGALSFGAGQRRRRRSPQQYRHYLSGRYDDRDDIYLVCVAGLLSVAGAKTRTCGRG